LYRAEEAYEEDKQPEYQDNQEEETIMPEDSGEMVLPEAQAEIITIQDGDVWRSNLDGDEKIKLIDRDNITDAKRSPLGRYIAYSYDVDVVETAEDYDGTNVTVEATKTVLMLADQNGTSSREVIEGVARWGWVPGADMLWYEKSILQRYYGFGYYGDQSIALLNPANLSSVTLLEAVEGVHSHLDYKWSPNGEHLSYFTYQSGQQCCNLQLNVVSRNTGKVVATMGVPYVGGDRGGPPPVPYYEWNKQGDAIYTGFTPLWFSDKEKASGFANEFKLGYTHFYRFDVKNNSVKLLNNQVKGVLMNNEILPKPLFIDGYSKVVFRKSTAPEDTQSWYYDRDISQLIILDLDTGEEQEIELEDPADTNYSFASYLDSRVQFPVSANSFIHLWQADSGAVMVGVYHSETASIRTVGSFLPSEKNYTQIFKTERLDTGEVLVLVGNQLYSISENGVFALESNITAFAAHE